MDYEEEFPTYLNSYSEAYNHEYDNSFEQSQKIYRLRADTPPLNLVPDDEIREEFNDEHDALIWARLIIFNVSSYFNFYGNMHAQYVWFFYWLIVLHLAFWAGHPAALSIHKS